MAGQDIPRPFAFDPKQITKMLDWAAQRIVEGPDPKAGARSFVELDPDLAGSITDDGIGADAAFTLFTDTIVPTIRPFDHPATQYDGREERLQHKPTAKLLHDDHCVDLGRDLAGLERWKPPSA